MKIVYCIPGLHRAAGMERVLTLKANYLAEHYGYDITIVLTEGKGKEPFYPLSAKIKTVNLDIDFDSTFRMPLWRKLWLYLQKQHLYRRRLTAELMRLRPDITVSLLRREINFLTSIGDGSKKVGEIHFSRSNYRRIEGNNPLKRLASWWWMRSLVGHLRRLDRFVVLTEEDKAAWTELDNVVVIANPLSFNPSGVSDLSAKRVIAVGRYTRQKGFDLLLSAWRVVGRRHPDWSLAVYGAGERDAYLQMAWQMGIDMGRCQLNGVTRDVEGEMRRSALFVLSSRHEGFSLVVVEAMACGLPVVAFACPCGPKDIITRGGVLVANGDVEALATAIDALISDEGKRHTLAQEARERAADFSIERIGEKWRQLFESLLS